MTLGLLITKVPQVAAHDWLILFSILVIFIYTHVHLYTNIDINKNIKRAILLTVITNIWTLQLEFLDMRWVCLRTNYMYFWVHFSFCRFVLSRFSPLYNSPCVCIIHMQYAYTFSFALFMNGVIATSFCGWIWLALYRRS